MSRSNKLAAVKRWLRLRNRQRLLKRELARAPEYVDWCARHDTLDGTTRTAVLEELERAARVGPLPLLTLIMDCQGASVASVRASWESLQAQWCTRWRCVACGPAEPKVLEWLGALAMSDERLRVSANISGSTAAAGHQRDVGAGAERWVGFVTPGDRWREHALALMAMAAARHPNLLLVYGDHDTLGADGRRRDPVFKPDWNADRLLAEDWIQTPVLWRADHLESVEATGACAGPHDRLLRTTAGVAPSRILHVPHVLVHRPPGAARPDADVAAVQRHLEAIGEAGVAYVERCGVHVEFTLPQQPPRASIIVPTRNGLDLLRPCITSLLEKTDYPDFEVVIVDNGSDDPECLRYLAGLTDSVKSREVAGNSRATPRVHVRRDEQPFNFAALNNEALVDCTGSVLALVNNDIEVIDRHWLREMVSLALRPGAGAVGARLLHGDSSVQHAGVILGIGGGAGHGLRWLPGDAPGPQGRVQQLMELSAVTAACLVVRRAHYEAVGGMDAAQFAVAFNDVDFCLRLRERGLRNLYTPHAVLYHHESATRGSDRDAKRRARFEAERDRFVRRWGACLSRDPAYNPNLSLANERFMLAEPPRLAMHCFEPDAPANVAPASARGIDNHRREWQPDRSGGSPV